MKHPIIAGTVAALLLAAVLLAAGACGGPDVSPGPASYLAVSGSKVAFIQWRTTSGGHLNGMITEGSVGGSGSAQTLAVSSAPFTGTMTGKSVKLVFTVPFFLRGHAHGSLGGGLLTMTVPQPDGTSRRATLRQSGKASYDRAIAALRAKIRHGAVLAARQQASQRHQPAHAQEEQSTQSSLNALYNESSLAFGGRIATSLARLADGILAAQSRLATEQQDASGDNKYCGAAFTVTGDSQAVDGAVQNAQGAVLSLMPHILAIRHDAAVATAYLRHLSKSGLPAPSLASNVIADANASLKQAVAMANADIARANAIDAHARSLAVKMAAGKCSSARSGSQPHFIPPIAPSSRPHH